MAGVSRWGEWDTLQRNEMLVLALGKVTHPSGAPDNHLLCVWATPNAQDPRGNNQAFDSGIYLIKSGKPVNEPGEMLLIKNDPKYHEQ